MVWVYSTFLIILIYSYLINAFQDSPTSYGNISSQFSCPNKNWHLIGTECYNPLITKLTWQESSYVCQQSDYDFSQLTVIDNYNKIKLFLNRFYNVDESFWTGWRIDTKNGTQIRAFFKDHVLSMAVTNLINKVNYINSTSNDNCISLKKSNGTLYFDVESCLTKNAIICETFSCFEDDFRCADNSQCIPKIYQCNAYPECNDGSDEKDCICSEPIIYDDTKSHGYILSPSVMSNDQNICTWMINQRQNTVISINILSLQLTEGERIFIQDIGYQNNITIYNNALTNITTWTSKTNHVQIEYHKSATRNGQFQLYYRTANDFYCSQTFSTYEGKILFYDFEEATNFKKCQWKIINETYQLMSVNILHLSSKNKHLLEISSNNNSSFNIPFSDQTNIPTSFITYSNNLSLALIKDPAPSFREEETNFEVTFQQSCQNINLNTSNHGQLFSPNYHDKFRVSKFGCSFLIRPPCASTSDGCFITIFSHIFNQTNSDYINMISDQKNISIDTLNGHDSSFTFYLNDKVGEIRIDMSTQFNPFFAAFFQYSIGCVRPVTTSTPTIINNDQGPFLPLSHATFECGEGTVLTDQTPLKCLLGGVWSNSPPECIKSQCSLPSIKNGYIRRLEGYALDSKLMYGCRVGYHSSLLTLTATCNHTMQWNPFPKCVKTMCEGGGGYDVLDLETFHCPLGQRLTHAISSRQCRLDGTWSHLLNPTCTPVSCIAPPIAFAGFPKKYIHFVKSNLEFECIDGYEKSHNETVYCNYDGNWMTQSEEMVKCVLKKNSIMDNCSCGGQKEINKCCSKKLCKNGGMGYTLKNGLIYCLCPVGFVGTRCEHGINICEMVGGSENYCNNQGECYVEGGKAMCKCNKLFHGDYCEHHRDFCVERNVTCFDKGVCATIHGTSETICKCQPNRFGKYCEKVMDYCKFDPCINNGSCIQDLNEGYVCLCQKDYSGRICQVNNSPCSNSPCSNGGKCIVQNDNEFACICSLRYTGKYCTEFVDLCKTANVDGNYCLNNATCHSIRGDQVVCECLDGFSGKQCQDEDVSVRDSYNLYFTPSKSYDMPSQISFNSTISVSANRTQKPLIISPAIRSSFLNETTICGWIKPDSTTKPNATFAVIGSYNGYEMVDSLLSFTDSQIIVNLKPPVILNYKLNTNRWQHFCLRSPRTRKRNFTSWDYFYNGDLLESSKDNVLPLYIDQRHIRLSLGQSLNFKTKFEGELTMIEMYSEVLSNNLIHDLATKCSANITRPPIIGWKDYSNTEGISGNVVKIEPGLCSNTSPVDRTGHILRDPSDTLPLTQNTNYNTKVINCPKNIINETDKDGLVIDWEPKNEKQIFENGPKIKNIFVNFASGSYFPIGSYQIIYIATNQYNVKSICQFSVVVKKKESSDRFHHYLFI